MPTSPSPNDQNKASTLFTWDAFLSYSTTGDYKLARKLEAFLESFHTNLGRAGQSVRPLHICRDGSDFTLPRNRPVNPADSDSIWQIVEEHLRQCEFLIVICSEQAVQSSWVAQEIEYMLKNRGPGNILLALSGKANPLQHPEQLFPLPIINSGLHTARIWYDLREMEQNPAPRVRIAEDEMVRMAADLGNWDVAQNGPIAPVWVREQKQRRHVRNILIGMAVTVIIVLAIYAIHEAVLAKRNEKQAKENEIVALSRQHAAQSILAVREGNLQQGFELALAAWQAKETQEAHTALFLAWQSGQNMTQVIEGFDPIEALAYTPGGKSILIWQASAKLSEWDIEANQVRREMKINHISNPSASTFNRDGSLLAVGNADGKITVYNTKNGDVSSQLHAPPGHRIVAQPVEALAFHPTKNILAAGYHADPALLIWDLASSRPTKYQPQIKDTGVQRGYIASIAFSPNGNKLAAVSDLPSSSVSIWKTTNAKYLGDHAPSEYLSAHSVVNFLSNNPNDGNEPLILSVGLKNGKLQNINLRSSEIFESRQPHEARITQIAGTKDMPISTGEDGLTTLGLQSNSILPLGWSRAPNHALAIEGMNFVAIGSADGTLIIYPLSNIGDNGIKIPVDRLIENRILFRKNKNFEMNQSKNISSVLILQDAKTGEALTSPIYGEEINSHNSQWIGVRTKNKKLYVLDTYAKNPVWLSVELPQGSEPIAFNVSGQSLLINLIRPGAVALANLNAVKISAKVLDLPKQEFSYILTSVWPKNTLIRQGEKLILLDGTSGKIIGSQLTLPQTKKGEKNSAWDFFGEEDVEYDFKWTTDGNWLLAGIKNNLYSLYRRQAEGLTIATYGTEHKYAELSANGRWLFSQRHGEYELQELATGKIYSIQLKHNLKGFYSVNFSPRGNFLATKNEIGNVKLQNVNDIFTSPNIDIISKAKDIKFTPDEQWIIAFTGESSYFFNTVNPKNDFWKLSGNWTNAKFSENGKFAALTTDNENNSIILDLKNKTRKKIFKIITGEFRDLEFSPNGMLLFSVDENGTYEVWDTSNAKRIGLPRFLPEDLKDRDYRFENRSSPFPEITNPHSMSPNAWVDDICNRTALANKVFLNIKTPNINATCKAHRLSHFLKNDAK